MLLTASAYLFTFTIFTLDKVTVFLILDYLKSLPVGYFPSTSALYYLHKSQSGTVKALNRISIKIGGFKEKPSISSSQPTI
jgi:hypothetical protein